MGKPRPFAEGTDVPVERSKYEIERLLSLHGATQFASAWDSVTGVAFMQCSIQGRMIKLEVKKPPREDFVVGPGGRHRNSDQVDKAVAAEERRRWRARLLITKAKLEMVASGDTTFDREFMADVMLPDGGTVADWLGPQIENAYKTGKAPLMLVGLPPADE